MRGYTLDPTLLHRRAGQDRAKPGRTGRAGGSAELYMDLQVQNVAFFITFAGVKSIELYVDLQVQNVAFFNTFPGVKSIELYMDLQVQNVAFFTTFSGVKSIELYMDLQVQNVAFFCYFPTPGGRGEGGSLPPLQK